MGLHLQKFRLRCRVLQLGVDPYAIPPSPRLPPCQPDGHPVVESAQNPPNVGCHHPCLRPVHHDQMKHRQVNMAQGPGVCTLPAQHPSQLRALLPCSMKIADHLWIVAVRRQENSNEIIEGGDQGKGNTIGCDHRLFPHPCLLLCQATSLTLLSQLSKV